MKKIGQLLHIQGIKRVLYLFPVNKVLAGTHASSFEKKRRLLNKIGFTIGKGTKIVAPIECTGKLTVGENCRIGR